jgi:hypothetical protein
MQHRSIFLSGNSPKPRFRLTAPAANVRIPNIGAISNKLNARKISVKADDAAKDRIWREIK